MIFEEVIPNIPRYYTALAEWASCVVYIMLLKRNYSRTKIAGRLAVGLLLQLIVQIIAGRLPEIFWIPGMLSAVTVMILLIQSCCRLPWENALYNGVRAFLLAELVASFEWQLYHFLLQGKAGDTFWVRGIYLVMIYGLGFVIAYILEKRVLAEGDVLQFSLREVLSAVTIGMLAFSLSNLSFVYQNTPFSSSFETEIFNIRTLVDLAGFTILYAYHAMLIEFHLRYERDTMEKMLENQLMQYKLSRESIDLVNRKYHDLKHQIAVLRAENNEEKRNAYLDAMESEIKVYEAQNKTGNSILDTVLTSKSLYCMKHQIGITCVADGTLLNFMDVMDICTIFGNALDNAIECELKIPDKEKRLIHLTVSAQKEFLTMEFENYCEEDLVLKDGLPMTSKRNRAYHGFGVKSIQQCAKKYGGTVSVSKENNWFILLVMIPMS
ncbi:ATP-binding protein [Frisingicoccus sp.]|uniref:ATP-binding protein n=1 Tax=Frisingicoccus sp. TaxID=1918627 RepID=UPI002ED0B0D9